MKRIIDKGGLIGECAKEYVNNDQKIHGFILECYAQCHASGAQRLWGSRLVQDILKYKANTDRVNRIIVVSRKRRHSLHRFLKLNRN